MSGIVGVVHRDGTLVDPRLLWRMTDALRNSGPDGQHVWAGGAVGFGHAWLRTSDDPAPATQPLSLDGRTWIVADARIDGRADLVRQLEARGGSGLRDATDAALILHAYRVWGESCARHLLGDFAFAIWDGARRRLYCARDHFGVKPLFYAHGPNFLVFSSSLDCVRLYPGVPRALDDQAIADFLYVGSLQEPSLTCFADIRRLPAAHSLLDEARVRVTRYWTLPVDGEVRYRRGGEYVEHFAEVLTQAVTDRLRSRSVGVLMSGGLDSTTIAATARRCLGGDAAAFELRAYTTVCDRIVADPERRYAALAAEALSMPIHYRVVDDYRVFERWDKPELRRPEPEADPLLALHVDQLNDAAGNGRVLLTGYGADPAMRLPLSYAVDLLRRGRLWRLAREVAQYARHCRRWPRVRLGVHARRCLGMDGGAADARPAWLGAQVPESRREPAAAGATHPTHPHAYELLTSSDWPQIFESYDSGVTGVPIDVRHPFFDRRLVEYVLAIPPMPWCFDKTIVRLAMRGALPDAVRLRPKTVAVADPIVALFRSPEAAWVDAFVPVDGLHRYVDRARIPGVCGDDDATAIWTHLRPLCLNEWLKAHHVT